MSKHRIFVLMIILSSTLAMVGGAGRAVASPEEVNAASIKYSHWWLTDYVDAYGDRGTHASIAFDPGNGTPWISYYDAENTALKVAHYKGSGGNCGPTSDWVCEIVDNSLDVGTYSSIDVHPNTTYPGNSRLVGVAYYDATNSALKFAEYSCFILPCEWDIVTVWDEDYLNAPGIGEYASMRYTDDGNPQIAFYISSNMLMIDDELDYAYKVTSGGNCGEGSADGNWHCEKVDSGDNVGQYASLGYSSFAANTYIAYYDGNNGDLKYAYYAGIGNCGTGNAWTCTTVDGTGGDDVGKFASIHVPTNVTDKLQIAYYDATHGELKYAKYVGSSGNCGVGAFRCDFIETMGVGLSQAGISLAVDNDNYPIIAYMRMWPALLGSPNLKVAQYVGAPGMDPGNCGPENPYPSWKCTTIDSGSVYAEDAEYASIAIDPDGLAMIAYSELFTRDEPDVYSLKIAYQTKALFLPIVKK